MFSRRFLFFCLVGLFFANSVASEPDNKDDKKNKKENNHFVQAMQFLDLLKILDAIEDRKTGEYFLKHFPATKHEKHKKYVKGLQVHGIECPLCQEHEKRCREIILTMAEQVLLREFFLQLKSKL